MSANKNPAKGTVLFACLTAACLVCLALGLSGCGKSTSSTSSETSKSTSSSGTGSSSGSGSGSSSSSGSGSGSSSSSGSGSGSSSSSDSYVKKEFGTGYHPEMNGPNDVSTRIDEDGYIITEKKDGSTEITDGWGLTGKDSNGDGVMDKYSTDGGKTWHKY